MNHCGFQQNGEPMVCPKPRRFNPIKQQPSRYQIWYGAPDPEPFGSKSGSELLDLILPPPPQQQTGGGCYGGPEPPFLSGSPPTRVSNPLINDSRFKNDVIISPIPPVMMIPNPTSGMTSSSPSFIRTSYGNKPVVRIEGFNCLNNRDNRRNCSVPALA